MKNLLITGTIASSLLLASPALADSFEEMHGEGATMFDINNSYVSFMGGYSLPTNAELESVAGIATPDLLDIELDDGFLAGIAIGKTVGNFRFEFETTYRKNEIDSYNLNVGGFTVTTTGDQEIDTLSLMANIFIDFEITDSTAFFIGGGVGAAYIDATVSATATDGGANTGSLVSDDTWVMAYQGMAGFSYELNRHTKLFVQYRLFTTDDPSFANSTVYEAPLSHEIVAGVTVAW